MSSRPVKSWAKGVEDYLKHIAEIKSEFKDVLEAHTNGVAPAPAPRVLAGALEGPESLARCRVRLNFQTKSTE